MNYNFLLLIIGAILSAYPVICIEKYILTNKLEFVIYGVSSNIILIYFYYLLFKNNPGKMYTIMKILSILMVVLSTYFFYNEKLNNYNIVGIVLSIITIFLLSIK
jgi:drug/metabolite transporter (DMT)-like permease